MIEFEGINTYLTHLYHSKTELMLNGIPDLPDLLINYTLKKGRKKLVIWRWFRLVFSIFNNNRAAWTSNKPINLSAHLITNTRTLTQEYSLTNMSTIQLFHNNTKSSYLNERTNIFLTKLHCKTFLCFTLLPETKILITGMKLWREKATDHTNIIFSFRHATQ